MDTQYPLPAEAFIDDAHYAATVLALVRSKLKAEVDRVRAIRGDGRQESFLGLFLSDADVDAVLEELRDAAAPGGTTDANREIELLAEYIARRVAATPQALPPQRLAALFGLGSLENDLLLYTLASEIDARFGRVYGYLHDDMGRRRPSPGLVLRFLDGAADNAQLRRALHPDAPLRRHRLIELPGDNSLPLIDRPLSLDDRMVDYMLGDPRPDARLTDVLRWRQAPPDEVRRASAGPLLNAVRAIAARWQAWQQPLSLLTGAGSDAELWCALFAAEVGLPLLVLDGQRMAQARLVEIALREAALQNALLLIQGVDTADAEIMHVLAHAAGARLCLAGRPAGLHAWNVNAINVELPRVDADVATALWSASLPQAGSSALAVTLGARYPFAWQDIDKITRSAATGADGEPAFLNELTQACRAHASSAMRDAAIKVRTDFTFTDLILPAANHRQLREIVSQQDHAGTVLDKWGLGQRFHRAPGSAVLFVGASGTGKTMAAGVLANELGVDLYRVDLAAVVSKYIGETEKNLDRVFDAASRSRIVLFIDEADALFGKRTEVKDAHDRYANVETSFLLQKMEDYAGIAILATNLSQNIDEAFFRRFHAVVDFPVPNAADRRRLWQRLTDSDAPLAPDVDLNFLAERFEMTGGHVRNCILTAAFLAAESGSSISMLQLMRAVGREYAKIGKPISKAAFGDYYAAIRQTGDVA